jgi:dihydroneopterin aldolase
MTTARLFLSGIRASGRHGANPGEKDEPQEFVVDLDLVVHVDDDAIESTAHYRGVRDAVRGVIADGSFDLIEVMANEVAERVLAFERVTRVTAVVHKPNAARRLEIDGVAAAVTLPPDPEPVGGIGSSEVAP